MAAAFVSLAAVVLVGLVLPDEPKGVLEEVAQRLLVVVLLAFPYLLFRFTIALRPASRRIDVTATAIAAATIVATLALPDFPNDEEARPGWFVAYLVFVLSAWWVVSFVVATRLWVAGRQESRIARRRMRLLSGAAVGMAAALAVSAASSGDDGALTVVSRITVLVSAALFLAGFAPPGLLRAVWRRPAEQAVRRAELELLAVNTPVEVTGILLPLACDLVGARGALFASETGDAIASHGDTDAPERHRVELQTGAVVVFTSPYAPIFGNEEFELLSALGAVTDLALERSRVLALERAAREDAERANVDLEQFAYAASHDLKEPLNVIAGFARILEMRFSETFDAQARESVDAILRASVRMESVINDLLRLSRIGRTLEDVRPVDLDEIARRALVDLGPKIDESRATIRVATLPGVLGDHGLLTQVFQNLVGNAIKYSGEGPPTVDIDAVLDGDSVVVSISDQGEGIPARYHEEIFAPLRRLHGEGGPPGTGIGLAIVKKIIEVHGGRIWVDSQEGAGATFRFTLPALDEAKGASGTEIAAGERAR